MMKERDLIMILVMVLSHQVSAYEGDKDSSPYLRGVCMLVFGIDPILVVLLVGSTILYYWHLYNIMQRNKNKSGSYWRD